MVRSREDEKRKTFSRTPIKIVKKKMIKCNSEEDNAETLFNETKASQAPRSRTKEWSKQLSTRRS